MLIDIAAGDGSNPRLCETTGFPLLAGSTGLCDKYICATATDGVSQAMTEKYLGKEAAKRLSSQGKFDPSSFTFAGGTFCDIKEKLCREDRYYGAEGKHSGAISTKYTRLLFGK